MKKINSLKQLKEEQQVLSQRKAILEKAIKNDWRQVKDSLHPLSKALNFFQSSRSKRESVNEPSVLADGISAVVSNYAEKLTGKFEKKIKEWLKPVH